MSVQREIVVPSMMATSAYLAIEKHASDHKEVGCVPGSMCSVYVGLTAALKWLSEHPISPSAQQSLSLRDLGLQVSRSYQTSEVTAASCVSVVLEWQRKMFLSNEPPVPEEIKDLLADGDMIDSSGMNKLAYNNQILEAFRRGRQLKEKP